LTFLRFLFKTSGRRCESAGETVQDAQRQSIDFTKKNPIVMMTNLLAAATSSDQTFVLFGGLLLLILIFWFFATEMERRKRNIGTIITAAVIVFSLFAICSPKGWMNVLSGKTKFAESSNLNGGIDIVGGTSFILQVQPKKDDVTGKEIPVSDGAMREAQKVIAKRIDEFGVGGAPVAVTGNNRLEVQLPGISPAEADIVEARLKKVARLTIHKTHRNSDAIVAGLLKADGTIDKSKERELFAEGFRVYPYTFYPKKGSEPIETWVVVDRTAMLGGKDVQRAWPNHKTGTSVSIELTSEGGDKMKAFTRTLTPQVDRMAAVLDGKVITNATLNASELGKRFEITGQKDIKECEELASGMSNPLDNPVDVIDRRSVSATLGAAVVKQGITAGIAGLLITLVFIAIYYRYAGIVALVGLTVNILILFGAMALLGASFTLPGIAGIILTIGVAVDANVLIYERLREELANGKSLGTALSTAYEKAFAAIFDANITTLLTAIILFVKASGSVKGFAVTLTVGIMGTLLAALIVTRVIFWWSRDLKIIKKDVKFLNLVPKRSIDFLGKRKLSFMLSSLLIIGGLATVGIKNDKALGVDFTGGTVLRFTNIPDALASKVSQTDIQQKLDKLKLSKPAASQLETTADGQTTIAIRLSELKEEEKMVVGTIRSAYPELAEKDAEDEYVVQTDSLTVKPTLGKEFLMNAIYALGLGLVAVLIYIALRFEFSFAVGAFAALAHDVLIVLGIVVIFGSQLSLIHVGAFLTIAGYSINDTIVVFDRIREILRSGRRSSVEEIMNTAIASTLSRTVITSATTFVAVLVLYIFGGAALKDFSLTIMIGVIVGTYSSIFVASPIVYMFSKKRGTDLRGELVKDDLDEGFEREVGGDTVDVDAEELPEKA